MSWKEKIKEWGGADLAFLSEDGEAICFIIVGEPILLVGKFKGKPSEKIGCPVVTEDGYSLLVAGKRLARKISKYESRFKDTAFIAVRHGEQNDITSTYELKIMDNSDLTQRLFVLAKKGITKAVIDESVEAALTVMKQ